MYKVLINPRWEITREGGAALDTPALLGLLRAIDETGSISQAAKIVGLSYRYAWGLLREAEKIFGHSLMSTGRGRGTSLTTLAEKLIWADRRITARLSPTLESLASELEAELGKTLVGQSKSIRLDASHGFAVAALLTHLEESRIPVAVRRQGLFVARGNPLNIQGLHVLTRPNVRFVNRQAGSGTRMLFELMLAGASNPTDAISGFENAEFTHSAVAAYIASGMADVGIGVQTAAQRFGLDFVPLVRERYFLALTSASLEDPMMKQVLSILRSDTLRQAINALPGYDAAETGTILSLSEAFDAKAAP